MFDHRFLASKVGLAALVSIAAMVSFNIFAFAQAAEARTHETATIVVPVVDLA